MEGGMRLLLTGTESEFLSLVFALPPRISFVVTV